MGRGLSELQCEILSIAGALGTVRPRNLTAPPEEQAGLLLHPVQPLVPLSICQRQMKTATAALYRSFARLQDRGLLDGNGRAGYRLTDAGWTWLMQHDPVMFPEHLVAEVR